MKTLTVVFVIFSVFSVYLNGVLSQHEHHPPSGADEYSEDFTITVKHGTKQYPSWTINGNKRRGNGNIDNIARAINVWGHKKNPPQSAQQSSGKGYLGLKIVHRYNLGKTSAGSHTLFLEKCSMTRLGTFIIKITADTLTPAERTVLQGAIQACSKATTTKPSTSV